MTTTALECFEERTDELLDILDTVKGPDTAKDLRNSNTVLCAAGHVFGLNG